MTTRTLYPTRKEIPPHLRCARSGCRRRAIVEPGVTPQVCLPHAKKRRTNKYGSKRSTSPLLGRSFHSQAERARGEELSLLERSGAIRGLRFQVPVPLRVNGKLVTTWVADFVYETSLGHYSGAKPMKFSVNADGEATTWMIVYEDLKGFRTPIFEIKRKLFFAVMGFDILVTPAYTSRPGRTNEWPKSKKSGGPSRGPTEDT